MFRLARRERDIWVTWPARVAALMAAEIAAEVEQQSGKPVTIEAAVVQRVLEPMSESSWAPSPPPRLPQMTETMRLIGKRSGCGRSDGGPRPRLRRRRSLAVRLAPGEAAGSGSDGLGMGGPAPQAVLTRLGRAGAVSNRAHALSARDHGYTVVAASGAAHQFSRHAKNIETGMPKNEVAMPR